MNQSARDKIAQNLAKRLGHDFKQLNLLDEALTHASASKKPDNEQLEFLGDRVLGLVIAEYLREAYPNEGEGEWARRLAVLTSRKICADIASNFNMQDALLIDSKNKKSVLSPNVSANLCEAIIAALYLDGGLEVARKFILMAWQNRLETQSEVPVSDKPALQEFTLANGLGLPVYEKVRQTGPDHAPEITVRVTLDDNRFAEAAARSRKEAEQIAARQLLELIKR